MCNGDGVAPSFLNLKARIMFIIFLDFLMDDQIFLTLQVKRNY